MATSNVTNKQIFLEQLNDEEARVLIPTMVYVALLLILGAIGNSCVIFYYRFRAKYTPHSYFILVLAVFDFCLCALCMPMEILEMRFFFMADDVMLCKIHRFSNYVFSMSSLFLLLSIAVERYRGICKPFKLKMTRIKAHITCVSCFLLGVLVSSPMLFFHDIIRVNVTSSGQYEVEVRYCTITKENSFQILYWITNFGYLLGFVCLSSALITLYSLIGKQMLKQSKFRKQAQKGLQKKNTDSPRYQSNRCIGDLNTGVSVEYVKDGDSTISWRQMNSDSKSHSEETNTNPSRRVGNYNTHTVSVVELKCQEPRLHVRKLSYEDESKTTTFTHNTNNSGKEEKEIDVCRQVTCESDTTNMNGESQRSLERTNKTGFQTSSRISDLQSRKFTLSMLLVTAAFILSYVPFLCLVIWRLTKDNSVLTNMSDPELVFYFIGLRSYLINSAINPIVFGVCNNQFREFFIAALCKKCRNTH